MRLGLLMSIWCWCGLLVAQAQPSWLLSRLSDAADDTAKVSLLSQISHEYLHHSPDTALMYALDAVALADRLQIKQWQASAAVACANAYLEMDGYEEAMERYGQALRLYSALKDRAGMATAWCGAGDVLCRQSDYEKALFFYKQAIVTRRQLGDQLGTAQILNLMGNAYEERGQLDKALEVHAEALTISQKFRHTPGTAMALDHTANVLLRQNKLTAAYTQAQEALILYRSMARPRELAHSLLTMSNIFSAQGDYPAALNYCLEAYQLFERTGSRSGRASALLQRGHIHYLRQAPEEAAKDYLAARQLCESVGNRYQLAQVLEHIGLLEVQQKKYEQAIKAYEQSLFLSEQIGDREGIARVNEDLGYLKLLQGQPDLALEQLFKALRLKEDLGASLTRTILHISRAYLYKNETATALIYAQRSFNLAKDTGEKLLIREAAEVLASLYTKNKDYPNALRFHELVKNYQDSLFAEDKMRALNLQLAQLEIRQKEAENVMLRREQQLSDEIIRRQEVLVITGALALLFIFALTVLLYRSNLSMKLLNAQLIEKHSEIMAQNEELHQQSEEIHAQAEKLRELNEHIKHSNVSLEEDLKTQNTHLATANRRLEENNKEMDEFLYHVSHDLRVPLTRLRGIYNVASLSIQDASTLELFERAQDTVYRMDRMLEKIMLMQDIFDRKARTNTIKIPQTIQHLLQKHRVAIENAHILTDIQIPENLTLHSYPLLFSVVFQNLLENAITFRKPLNPVIQCHFTALEDGISFGLEDNGTGIYAEELPRIFEMYHRANEQSQGNGLGLYLVKKAIDRMRGSIEVESVEGQYTRFRVRLPHIY